MREGERCFASSYSWRSKKAEKAASNSLVYMESPLFPLTTPIFWPKIPLRVLTENSTPRSGFRERMAGANPPKAWREGPLERGQEMARRRPPLSGKSAHQPDGNSGGTTDMYLFALSPKGSGRFCFCPESQQKSRQKRRLST